MEFKKLLGIKTPVTSLNEEVLTPYRASNLPGAIIHKFIMRGMLPENVQETKTAALINRQVPEIAEPVGMAVQALRDHVQIRTNFSDYNPLEKDSDLFVSMEELPNYLINEGIAASRRGDLFGFDILQEPVDGVGEVIDKRSVIVSRLLDSSVPVLGETNLSQEAEVTMPTLVERLKEISQGGQIEINLYIVSSRVYLE